MYEKEIEQYIQNEMTKDELTAFELRLHSDKVLADQVDQQRLALSYVHALGELSLKSRLKSIARRKQNANKLWLTLAIAMTFSALFYGYYHWNSDEKLEEEELYFAYFEPYRNAISVRGTTTDLSNMELGHQAYKNKKYAIANEAYSKALLADEKPTHLIQFYKAISLLALKNPTYYPEASNLLNSVVEGKHAYVDQATYYLALTYIAQDQVELAMPLLKKLQEAGTYNPEQVSELINKID